MSSQRRFEGTNLEALLDEVRDALGDDVHIVAANRVRKGGVGGFFAREYFEVIAEEPDVPIDLRPAVRLGRRRRDAAAAAGDGSRSVPRSVLDLVEERNAEERAAGFGGIDLGEPVVGIAEYAESDAFVSGGPTWSRHDEVSVEPVPYVAPAPEPTPRVEIAPADAFVDVHLDAQPRVSTETERFAQILERLAHTTEHRGPVATPPAATAMPAPAVAPQPAAAPRPPAAPPQPTITPAAAPAPAPATRAPDVVSLVDVEREARAVAAAAAPAAPVAPREVARDMVEETIERPEQKLVRLGLPARYAPRGMAGNALHDALVESLERLPRADELPKTKGVVIAIVGLGARPVLLARSISEELGLDPDEVVVATQSEIDGVPAWLQITEPDAANERRRSWRRRDQLTFVAVSQPSLTSATAWASSMLDQLEPTQLWALASAGWKPEDVDAWSRRMGGFDLLALDRLIDTVSPASMLSLGIPVGRLDGADATPARWADVLIDRINDTDVTADASGMVRA